MVSAPAAPVSDYTDTKSVFLFQILAEKACTASETETNAETEKTGFQEGIFTYYFFIQKLSKI